MCTDIWRQVLEWAGVFRCRVKHQNTTTGSTNKQKLQDTQWTTTDEYREGRSTHWSQQKLQTLHTHTHTCSNFSLARKSTTTIKHCREESSGSGEQTGLCTLWGRGCPSPGHNTSTHNILQQRVSSGYRTQSWLNRKCTFSAWRRRSTTHKQSNTESPQDSQRSTAARVNTPHWSAGCNSPCGIPGLWAAFRWGTDPRYRW